MSLGLAAVSPLGWVGGWMGEKSSFRPFPSFAPTTWTMSKNAFTAFGFGILLFLLAKSPKTKKGEKLDQKYEMSSQSGSFPLPGAFWFLLKALEGKRGTSECFLLWGLAGNMK